MLPHKKVLCNLIAIEKQERKAMIKKKKKKRYEKLRQRIFENSRS